MEEAEREALAINDRYIKKYMQYAFRYGDETEDNVQTEAIMLKLIHAIEKGLANEKYKYGSGKDAVTYLLNVLLNCQRTEIGETYDTAVSACKAYIEKNDGIVELGDIKRLVSKLRVDENDKAGTKHYGKSHHQNCFSELVKARRSVRHFSGIPVKDEEILTALNIAQHTPSACNRQEWKVRIVTNKQQMREILDNQNGNKGFGDEIDKLMIITCDLRCMNIDREEFQAYIDGGMYAMTLLYALEEGEIVRKLAPS